MDGEQTLLRFGKKIAGRYALITAYYKKPKLRFVVYMSSSCSKMILTCVHEEIERLDPSSTEEVRRIVKAVASDLSFDDSGKLQFGANVPAVWQTQ
jgi:rRNA-processing protein FCF1